MISLALRQMLARKKQTTLIFLGISFGTMIYVVICGIQLGFRQYIAEQLLNNTAHIIISGSDRTIDATSVRNQFFPEENTMVNWIIPPSGKREEARLQDPQGWFELLQRDLNVVAYAPRITINALASQGGIRQNISFIGIIPQKQINITSIEDYMKEGSLLDLSSGGNTVVLTSGVLKKLGAKVGDQIKISAGIAEPRPFKIVGRLHFGNEQLDNVTGFANLSDVQALNRTPGRVTEITVALDDMNIAQAIADKWELYGRDKVQSWQEANTAFMQLINIQDIVRYVITSSILLVAGFGIYNVLSIMISQKQKEIAILRSIGYGPEKILQLFLYQGLILGLLGGTLGLCLGFGLNKLVGSIDLGMEIGKGRTLIISYAPQIYVIAFVAAQVAAAIASIIPARRAAKLTPLEIIRSNL